MKELPLVIACVLVGMLLAFALVIVAEHITGTSLEALL